MLKLFIAFLFVVLGLSLIGGYSRVLAQGKEQGVKSTKIDSGARTWTSKSGTTVEAKLVKVTGNKIKLARASDGKTFEVDVKQFNDSDKLYVEEWIASETSKEDMVKEDMSKKGNPRENEFVDNFDEDWPKLIKLVKDFEITTVSEKDGVFVYESRHFTFQADARLQKSTVKRFAELFEATLQYCKELPISSQVAIYHTAEKKKKIFLYADKGNYYKAGGPEGSAGVYIWNGKSDKIMVGMPFLGLEKVGSGYKLDRDRGLGTLPHEIAHMFSDKCYYSPGARGWFSEGLAEYISNTPYRGAKFNVSNNRSSIIEAVTGFGKDGKGGKNLGEEINVGPLEDYMLQSYANFTGPRASLNYGVSNLIVYYFFHFDGEGERKVINAFMKALQEGKQGKEVLEVLLQGRTMLELEEQITRAWRSRGIKLKFSQ